MAMQDYYKNKLISKSSGSSSWRDHTLEENEMNFRNILQQLQLKKDLCLMDIIDYNFMSPKYNETSYHIMRRNNNNQGWKSLKKQTTIENFKLQDCTFMLHKHMHGDSFDVGYKNSDMSDFQMLLSDSQDEKIKLNKNYDYVVACCLYGCNKKKLDKKRWFNISAH